MYPKYTPKQIVRFFSRIRIPENLDDCWEWTAYTNIKGYGRFRANGRNVLAHRMLWGLVKGAIPEGLTVCHHCDNPHCCNPTHLFLGTNADNTADKMRKGRHPRGNAHPQAKLTKEQAEQIRQIYADGGTNYRQLANRFGVHHSIIWRVIKHIAY